MQWDTCHHGAMRRQCWMLPLLHLLAALWVCTGADLTAESACGNATSVVSVAFDLDAPPGCKSCNVSDHCCLDTFLPVQPLALSVQTRNTSRHAWLDSAPEPMVRQDMHRNQMVLSSQPAQPNALLHSSADSSKYTFHCSQVLTLHKEYAAQRANAPERSPQPRCCTHGKMYASNVQRFKLLAGSPSC